ncbi:MAG TPA: YciI family protein [Flavihumibacter sp.]
MKEFLLLIRENANYGQLSPEQMQNCVQEHIAWVQSLVERGHYERANPLEPEGSVIREGRVTDGPLIETKECVSGFYLLLANSLEEATAIGLECPDVQLGATIEIRPLMPMNEA